MITTVLILGGEPPSSELVRHTCRQPAFLIAADGGYEAFHGAGVEPDVLVGDFDSLTTPVRKIRCRKIQAPEQTATDFEKALRLLPEETTELRILGGMGRRMDHCLNNLLIAAALHPALCLTFLDEKQELIRTTPECPFRNRVTTGSLVSIVPFPRCERVSTSGFQWNLSNSPLNAEQQLSQSNRAAETELSVTVGVGVLYVVTNFSAG